MKYLLTFILLALLIIACSENPSKPPEIPEPAHLILVGGTLRVYVSGSAKYPYLMVSTWVSNDGKETGNNCYGLFALMDSTGYMFQSTLYYCNPSVIEAGERAELKTINHTDGYIGIAYNAETPPVYWGVILVPGGEFYIDAIEGAKKIVGIQSIPENLYEYMKEQMLAQLK